jgi:hypothetical protein
MPEPDRDADSDPEVTAMATTNMSARWRVVVAAGGAAGVVAAAVAGVGASGASADTERGYHVRLDGYSENLQALSTSGRGDLRLRTDEDGFSYRLRYRGLEGDVTMAHLHFGRFYQNGGISVWLCQTEAAPGPEGTPTCPAPGGTVSGSFEADDVVGPTAQGIDAGSLAELRRALRAGAVYVNVHSTLYPGGEIRGQLLRHGHDH